MMDQVFQHRSVQNGLRLKFLAGNGRADHGEDPRPDYRSNAKGSERPKTEFSGELLSRFGRFRNRRLDGLFCKELARHKGSLVKLLDWAVQPILRFGPIPCVLPLGLTANKLLNLGLLGAAWVLPGFLCRLLLAGNPLGFLAFFLT